MLREYKLIVEDDGRVVLKEGSPSADRSRRKVPYRSQWGSGAKRFRYDCGPACVWMIGEYHRGLQEHTADSIMAWLTRGKDKYTSASDLVKAAKHFYGLEMLKVYAASWGRLKTELALGPVIILGHYGSFVGRIDRGFTGGHWFVVVDWEQIYLPEGIVEERFIVHDPDWWGKYIHQGAYIPMVAPMFADIWGLCHLDHGNPDHMMLVVK